MLTNNYNAPWDKNLWGDIFAYGYVRDIADWFISNKLEHKIGTIYALLNSLYRVDLSLYANLLLKVLGTYSFEKDEIVVYSAKIVDKFLPSIFEKIIIDLKHIDNNTFNILLQLLFSGMACCHLENKEKWNWVYDYYDNVRLKYTTNYNKQHEMGGIKNEFCV